MRSAFGPMPWNASRKIISIPLPASHFIEVSSTVFFAGSPNGVQVAPVAFAVLLAVGYVGLRSVRMLRPRFPVRGRA